MYIVLNKYIFVCNEMHVTRYASDRVDVDKAAHLLRLNLGFVIFALVWGMMWMGWFPMAPRAHMPERLRFRFTRTSEK